MESYALGNLEKMLKRLFKLEADSLTNDQILAFKDGLRYFVRRVLTAGNVQRFGS